MPTTAGYIAFEPQDFHAHSAYVHSKSADGHAQSAMMENDDAYQHHLNAAGAHDAAAKAHLKAHEHLPLPVNASKPDEGTAIPTAHPTKEVK